MEPRPRFNLPDAIVALLAGELEGGWRLAWRRRLFLFYTRVQAFLPLVPRISFAENGAADGTADYAKAADEKPARTT